MSMPDLLDHARCPHCGINRPSLKAETGEVPTSDHRQQRHRLWRVYVCANCGGAILAGSPNQFPKDIKELYPAPQEVDENVPAEPGRFLRQALDTIHSPDASVLMSNSAVDAMLKERGYADRKENLKTRINKAAADHVITEDMAKWAHDVRLDANDRRHADPDAPPASEHDAQRCIDFAQTLGLVLFVLPARVERGRADAAGDQSEPSGTT